MNTLELVVKKQWFDMILSGEKPEEYRDVTPYWIKRIARKEYDAVRFRNGYATKARVVTREFKGVSIGPARREWGSDSMAIFVIRLGKILKKENI